MSCRSRITHRSLWSLVRSANINIMTSNRFIASPTVLTVRMNQGENLSDKNYSRHGRWAQRDSQLKKASCLSKWFYRSNCECVTDGKIQKRVLYALLHLRFHLHRRLALTDDDSRFRSMVSWGNVLDSTSVSQPSEGWMTYGRLYKSIMCLFTTVSVLCCLHSAADHKIILTCLSD